MSEAPQQHDRVCTITLKTDMNSHSSELSAGQKLVKSETNTSQVPPTSDCHRASDRSRRQLS